MPTSSACFDYDEQQSWQRLDSKSTSILRTTYLTVEIGMPNDVMADLAALLRLSEVDAILKGLQIDCQRRVGPLVIVLIHFDLPRCMCWGSIQLLLSGFQG